VVGWLVLRLGLFFFVIFGNALLVVYSYFGQSAGFVL